MKKLYEFIHKYVSIFNDRFKIWALRLTWKSTDRRSEKSGTKRLYTCWRVFVSRPVEIFCDAREGARRTLKERPQCLIYTSLWESRFSKRLSNQSWNGMTIRVYSYQILVIFNMKLREFANEKKRLWVRKCFINLVSWELEKRGND